MLLSLLVSSNVFAASLSVLPMPPIEADGQSVVQVQVHAPGVVPGDRLRVQASSGEVGAAAIPANDLILFEFTPSQAYSNTDATVRIRVRGKHDEELRIPLVPSPMGELSVAFEPQTWTAGDRGTVALTVSAEGPHPLPLEGRSVMLEASSGRVGPLTQNDDGTWSATWTPTSSFSDPQHVVFTATDATTPNQVVGYGALPVLLERAQQVSAPAGSQNVLVIGNAQYGPTTAGPDGVTVTAKLDPRVTTATLQSVDELGNRKDSQVTLELNSPDLLALAPLPAVLPTDHTLVVHVLALSGDGEAWRGEAPKLNGASGENLGEGWYRFTLTTAADPGSLSIEATLGELKDSHKITLVDAVPRVALSSDPAALKEKERDFHVTAHLQRADGAAMTKRKIQVQAEGASKLAGTRDNGDGTYTQKLRMSSKADDATVRVRPVYKATGLPVRHVVMWMDQGSLPADGSATATLTLVALDATGVPVPNTEIELSVPVGSAAMEPSVKTDSGGVAHVQVRAGTEAGFVGLQASAGGVVGRSVLVLHAPDQSAGAVETGGSAEDRARVARWQQTLVSLKVGRVGADVGAPSAVQVASVPTYTTPGAALLVTIKVLDPAGKAIVDQAPQVTASVGTVGTLQNNGDGSYNVPVQLPPGVDGPLTLSATVGTASGTLELPTLAQMSADAADTDGGRDKPPRDGSSGGSSGFSGNARLMGAVVQYRHSAVRDNNDGNGRVPSSVAFSKMAIPAAVIQLDGHGGPQGMIGFDAGLRAGRYKMKVSGVEMADTILPAHAALTVGSVQGAAYFFGGLGVGLVDMPVLRYNETLTDIGSYDRRMAGARLSAGVALDTETRGFRFDLAETFAPRPVMTELNTYLDIPVSDPIAVSLGYQLHLHHARLAVPPSGDVADIAKIRALQGAASIGVNARF